MTSQGHAAVLQPGAVISYLFPGDPRPRYGKVVVVHTAHAIDGSDDDSTALEVDTDPVRLERGGPGSYGGGGVIVDPAKVTVIDLPELRAGQVWECEGSQWRLLSPSSRFSAELVRTSGLGNRARFLLAHPAWRLVSQPSE